MGRILKVIAAFAPDGAVARNPRGSALIGALAAVTVSGIIGVSIAATYEHFVHQSRQAYLRSVATAVDNRIRLMAMQPYAYTCGSDRTGDSANQVDGIGSCVINRAYFNSVLQTNLPVKCPPGPGGAHQECGLRLDFLPGDVLNYKTVTNPNTGDTETQALFPYKLTYEGTDYPIAFGGYDIFTPPVASTVGLPIPREVLQSQAFDCSQISSGTTPVFGGFDAAGKPICRGFNTCPRGTYANGLHFDQLNAANPQATQLKLDCKPLQTADKVINCDNGGQSMVSNVSFDNGVMSAGCTTLQVPDLGGANASSTNGPPPPPVPCADVTYQTNVGGSYPSGECGPNCVKKNRAIPDSVVPPDGCRISSYTVQYRFYAGPGFYPQCQYWTGPVTVTPGDTSLHTQGFGGSCGPKVNNKISCTYFQMDGPRSFYFADVTYGYSSGATACLGDMMIQIHSVRN